MSTTRRGAARIGDTAAALLAGAATTVLALVELRHGVALGPDAWAYWGASVSLLAGDGYVDAHGLPVVAWPPLYPLWLAAAQAVGGVSMGSARLADALALGAAACLFSLWALRRTRGEGGAARWPVCAFVTAALLVQLRGLASNYLMLALLGGFLLALDGAGRAATARARWSLLALAAGLAAAMVLTRNAALAFVGAGALVIALQPSAWRTRVAGAGVVVGLALLAWWAARVALGQAGTHHFHSERELLPTAWYMLQHVGRGLAPFPIGIAVFVAVAWLCTFAPRRLRPPALAGQHDAVVFALAALLATLAMFLLVTVADPPGDRFVGFAALMLGGLAAGAARHLRHGRWRWLALALLLLPPAARAGKHVVAGRIGANTANEQGGESFLPPTATLDRHHAAGTTLPDGREVVAPPLFEWDRRRLERGERRR